jgi:HD superfamily phosphohydrolase
MKAEGVFADLRRQSSLSRAIDTVESIWGERMAAYSAEVASGTGKSIKDAVWGMIELRPEEVVLADSPMLQRLRRIRQLGLSYLTYPTAGYSRFEHTLGALHQSERMLRAVGSRSEGLQEQVMSTLRVVRLASLLHDVGHLPLSHISERYYSLEECLNEDLAAEAQAILKDFANTLGVPKPQLAECLSVIVIATPGMEGVLGKAGYTPGEIASAALAIVGRSWSPDEFFVTQIISNVVDADKLDYMFRDGFVTRVPLAVDLERLLYKLEVVRVPAVILPATRLGHIAHDAEVLVLGTSVAGERLAYEVSQARSMLFERVYFHHKTRAAERVALQALADLNKSALELLEFDDSLFGGYGAARFPRALTDTASRLEDRRLPRRLLAVSTAFASAQMLDDLWQQDQDDGLSDDYLDDIPEQDKRDAGGAQILAKRGIEWMLNRPEDRKALGETILAEIGRLGTLLGKPGKARVWIDTVAKHPSPGDTTLVVVRPDGSAGAEQGYAPTAAAETYEPLHIAFVFLDDSPDRLALAYVACELALADKSAVVFDRRAADYAKVNFADVEDCKRAAERANPDMFAKHGALRPSSEYAGSAAAAKSIDKLAERFHKYSTDHEVHVDAARIRLFLDQFPESLVASMLAALKRVKFLDREVFSGFAAYLDESAPDGAVLVPLTSAFGKSADHLPYFFADQALGSEVVSLVDALAGDAPIVIYDDLLLSGTQSEKILRTWKGQRRHKSSQRLDPDQFGSLAEHLHSFRFGWAWEPGVERLQEVANELGLSTDVQGMREDPADESPLAGLPQEHDLRAFLGDVGKSLLMTTRGQQPNEAWDEGLCEQNALGYGNSERLIVTEYNAPAGTMTALWKRGAFRRAEWLPLFPRRRG